MNPSYLEVVAYLENLGIMPKTAPGIEKIQRALGELSLRIDPNRVTVVAGTNGKGTTCIFLEALLRASGRRVGLYTSPHLVSTTERIRVDGQPILESEFVETFLRLRRVIEAHQLSHFEALTLMAVELFVRLKMDHIVLEVGLGGLWDATNAVPHQFCVITPLSFDHENLLGNTLESIARNKFGIVGSGANVVYSPLHQSLIDLQKERIHETKSTWVPQIPMSLVVEPGVEPAFYLDCLGQRVRLPLPGLRAAENAALALTAFRQLGGDPLKYLSALSEVRWPGRMERFDCPLAPCPVYLSGDHNPQGIASLIELLGHYVYKHVHFLVGIGKDKAAKSMLDSLLAVPGARIYLTETPFKGLSLAEYDEAHRGASFVMDESPFPAFLKVLELAQSGDLVVVTGSLYLIGEIKRISALKHQNSH